MEHQKRRRLIIIKMGIIIKINNNKQCLLLNQGILSWLKIQTIIHLNSLFNRSRHPMRFTIQIALKVSSLMPKYLLRIRPFSWLRRGDWRSNQYLTICMNPWLRPRVPIDMKPNIVNAKVYQIKIMWSYKTKCANLSNLIFLSLTRAQSADRPKLLLISYPKLKSPQQINKEICSSKLRTSFNINRQWKAKVPSELLGNRFLSKALQNRK